MRLFLAIDLPKDIRAKIYNVSNQLSKHLRAKFVSLKNLHITLKFLGEVADLSPLDPLKNLNFKPFTVSLSKIGAFPNLNYIKVLWVGIDKGADQIVALHNNIESILPFPKDKKFHPHITIARVRSKPDKKALQIISTAKFDSEFDVNSFSLYKSTLTSSGPVYEKIFSCPSQP